VADCKPACLVLLHALALLSVVVPFGKPFLDGTAKPLETALSSP
jgi:hypothetical protein